MCECVRGGGSADGGVREEDATIPRHKQVKGPKSPHLYLALCFLHCCVAFHWSFTISDCLEKNIAAVLATSQIENRVQRARHLFKEAGGMQ